MNNLTILIKIKFHKLLKSIPKIMFLFIFIPFAVSCDSTSTHTEKSIISKAAFVFFSGKIEIKKKNQSAFRKANWTDEIIDGDSIRTGNKSSCDIQSGDNCVRMLENSTITWGIIKPSSTAPDDLFLQTGKVIARVKHIQDHSNSFIVRSITASVGVRGTEFAVTADENDSRILVIQGRVAVWINSNTHPIIVAQNIQSNKSITEMEVKDGQNLIVHSAPLKKIEEQMTSKQNIPNELLQSVFSYTQPAQSEIGEIQSITEELKIHQTIRSNQGLPFIGTNKPIHFDLPEDAVLEVNGIPVLRGSGDVTLKSGDMLIRVKRNGYYDWTNTIQKDGPATIPVEQKRINSTEPEIRLDKKFEKNKSGLIE